MKANPSPHASALRAIVTEWARIIRQYPTTWLQDRAIWCGVAELFTERNIDKAERVAVARLDDPLVRELTVRFGKIYLEKTK